VVEEPRLDLTISDATPDDIPAIVEIVNDVIRTSDAIWSEDLVTVEQRLQWLRLRQQSGFVVLAARRGPELVGFATYGPFRDFPGYSQTVELTIHTAAGHRGRGIGTKLLEALIERARDARLHVMVAGVDAGNLGSIRLHERLGFTEVARMPEVGRKAGRWLDLVLLQLVLD
jgi:phosphinothricin acetyltransferase